MIISLTETAECREEVEAEEHFAIDDFVVDGATA
jgi:hypothetical protein